MKKLKIKKKDILLRVEKLERSLRDANDEIFILRERLLDLRKTVVSLSDANGVPVNPEPSDYMILKDMREKSKEMSCV